MSTDLKNAAAYATLALGAGQALAPGATAKVFGLEPLDGQAEWLARLLGCANLGIGALFLTESVQEEAKAQRLALLGGNAAVTVLAAAKGGIPKRTAVSVLAFIAALLPGALAD